MNAQAPATTTTTIREMAGPAGPVVEVGDTVLLYGITSNGSGEHPALVTRVWGSDMVNVMAFLDMDTPQCFGSVARLQGGEMVIEGSYRWKFPG